MKASELRNLDINELLAKDKELDKELFNLSFQLHTGRLENTAKLTALRKDIARVKTLIHETRVERG
ncbi:50S ribosomal protein L29 [Geobacter pelophilus]|jgi:large subunit ribosomal protein L29|uniref:Large ribosomal subunit protein uL29 n=1 Tax=Geoanaerobacter pelophilus TaxID=60036 RepID=A0AAW4L9V1_9BACT|nr:50S ribosomal protein L29 [Geoanaerobacter pelophilus]MBT0666630.1 50S ribosomal protein L29 [Geoanaerobacter pelophilus]